MAQSKTLRWDNADHYLVLTETEDGVLCQMRIIKGENTQDVPDFYLPKPISLQDVLAAWEKQKCAWKILATLKGNPFVALRVIWLPHGYCITWLVVHIGGIPSDLCNCAPLTEERWAFDELNLIAVTE